MSYCTQCKIDKPVEAFKKDNRSKSGVSSWCKGCDNLNHRERRRLRTPERLEADRLKGRAYNKQYYYGISMEAYEEMLESHGSVCAICKRPETRIVKGSRSTLSIDHDHKTGVIRGLLCDRCNKILGLWEDNPDRFRAAATYLEVAK